MRAFGLTFTLALTLLAGPLAASADPLRPPRAQGEFYPPQVNAVLGEARKACRDAEGRKVTFQDGAVRRLDLTGHGRVDYVVDLSHATCDAAESLYCGTGGCELVILTKLPGGALTRVFEGRVLTHEVIPGAGAKRIRFRLHGSFCGKFGPEKCEKVRRIDGRVFEFRQPK